MEGQLRAMEEFLRAGRGSGGDPPPNVRVKAEIEWPRFDGTDPYYDVGEYFKDLKRVMMLASGGKGCAAHERLELLRGTLSGVPLLDFKTYVDDHAVRNLTLERGSTAAREALWEEVEAYLKRSFHRPLLERQRRARAEYNGCSMRDGAIKDYMTFQTEFKRCLKNLERSGLAKAREEVKVDFIEKLTEESATHLMLTPFTDHRTGEVGTVQDLESAMEMARQYFAVQDTKKRVFTTEEVNVNREARILGRQSPQPSGARISPGTPEKVATGPSRSMR